MRTISAIGVLGIFLAIVTGCSQRSDQEIVVYTSVDQVFSEPVFRAFKQASGVRVRAVYDTEETKVIFEKAYPKLWQNVLSCHYWIERQ